jgi:hypothetical protein
MVSWEKGISNKTFSKNMQTASDCETRKEFHTLHFIKNMREEKF